MSKKPWYINIATLETSHGKRPNKDWVLLPRNTKIVWRDLRFSKHIACYAPGIPDGEGNHYANKYWVSATSKELDIMSTIRIERLLQAITHTPEDYPSFYLINVDWSI